MCRTLLSTCSVNTMLPATVYAGPLVSSNGIPYMATIEPVCYVITNTRHTLINFYKACRNISRAIRTSPRKPAADS